MRYAVLGGGALGLTVALRLAERGDQVVLYERENVAGGLAAGFPLGNSHLEKFYHHLFKTDHDAVRLINEMGLGDRLTWKRPVTAVQEGGRLWPLDSARSVLKFKPLPFTDRLRFGAATGFLKALPSPRILEDETASQWLVRWMGPGPYRVLWQPLLESKFGSHQDEIAMPWFWARIHFRTASLGYLRGGFQQLYDTLMFRLAALRADVRLGTEVKEIVRDGAQLRIATLEGEERFDRVISTLPTRLTIQLSPQIPQWYRDRYQKTEAYGAMCLILALNRRLTDAYWINIADEGYPFQPLVEHTNLMSPDDYGGRHLVYLGKYMPMRADLMSASKQEVLSRFLPGIRKLNSSFEASWITDSWLFRAPFAQPIVTRGYRHRIPPHTGPMPGLFLANMFQIYPHDRGQNYSIRMANELSGL